MRPWLIAGGLLVLLVALTVRTAEDPPITSPTATPLSPTATPLRVRPVNMPDPLTIELQRLQDEAQRYRTVVFVN
jgi:hypothetical protein